MLVTIFFLTAIVLASPFNPPLHSRDSSLPPQADNDICLMICGSQELQCGASSVRHFSAFFKSVVEFDTNFDISQYSKKMGVKSSVLSFIVLTLTDSTGMLDLLQQS